MATILAMRAKTVNIVTIAILGEAVAFAHQVKRKNLKLFKNLQQHLNVKPLQKKERDVKDQRLLAGIVGSILKELL